MNLLIGLIDRLIGLYELVIIVRCILSFVQPNPFNPIVRFLYQITDPLLDAVRRAFPFLVTGGFDLSPILVFFLLQVTRQYLVSFAHRGWF